MCVVWSELRTAELHSGTENLMFEENCILAPRVAEQGECWKHLHRCRRGLKLSPTNSLHETHKGIQLQQLSEAAVSQPRTNPRPLSPENRSDGRERSKTTPAQRGVSRVDVVSTHAELNQQHVNKHYLSWLTPN